MGELTTGADDTDLMEAPEGYLEALGPRFLQAMDLLRQGHTDSASEILREILAEEPRLPEPRLELARLALDGGLLDEAEAQARQGLGLLEAGGQWIDDLPEATVQSLAHGLLAEILRKQADRDEVIFGEPERLRGLLDEARQHFDKAARMDPDNEHAAYYASFLGLGEESGEE